MKKFAEDENVVSKFCSVALSRKIVPQPSQLMEGLQNTVLIIIMVCLIDSILSVEQSHQPIKLKFSDPRCYGSSTLYKLIPRITNPRGTLISTQKSCMRD